jgi:hypothetical protein
MNRSLLGPWLMSMRLKAAARAQDHAAARAAASHCGSRDHRPVAAVRRRG